MNEIIDYLKTDDGRICFDRILSHLDKIDALDSVIINKLIEGFPEYKYSGEAYRVIWKKKNLLNHFGFDGKELDWIGIIQNQMHLGRLTWMPLIIFLILSMALLIMTQILFVKYIKPK